mmetsp:Transcript_6045/g.7041  ORF Transcript_6045/g.7041 Transcript_6045/m.7041 type:complete len:153 (+) Transcript_6045:74-532(+)
MVAIEDRPGGGGGDRVLSPPSIGTQLRYRSLSRSSVTDHRYSIVGFLRPPTHTHTIHTLVVVHTVAIHQERGHLISCVGNHTLPLLTLPLLILTNPAPLLVWWRNGRCSLSLSLSFRSCSSISSLCAGGEGRSFFLGDKDKAQDNDKVGCLS